MNMKIIRQLPFIACIGVFALMSGCAASGPIFEPAAPAIDDQALIYIYRPGKFMGGGVAFDIHASAGSDDVEIVTLKSGGYFPYYVSPGELELWGKTESKSSVTLDVRAGDVQYVRGSVGAGIIMGRPKLSVVDAETGAAEIKECKLLQPK